MRYPKHIATLLAITLMIPGLAHAGQIYTFYDFVVIHYNPGQVDLWQRDQEQLQAILQSKIGDGQLAGITVATWADREIPKPSLMQIEDTELVRERQVRLRALIAGEVGSTEESKLRFFNMANPEDKLVSRLATHNSRAINASFDNAREKQVDLMLKPEVRIINKNAYPSRSVVVIAVEKELKLRMGGFGSVEL